jgi:AraC-like DNA-binding protein
MIQIHEITPYVTVKEPIKVQITHSDRVRRCGGDPVLIFADGGRVTVCLDGRSYAIGGQEIMLLPPHSEYHLQIAPGSSAHVISFASERRFEPGVYSGDLRGVIKEIHEKADGWEQMVQILLEQQLIVCLRTGCADYLSRAVSTQSSVQHIWLVHRVQEYLDSHFHERITLDRLAELHDVSVTQLKRVFKEQTGTTIISYLTDHRMAAAKKLIAAHKMTFTEIAEAVGYDSIYYFSTQFKKQTGMTPTEYSKTCP